MKICVPVQNREELLSRLDPFLGTSKYFAIYDDEILGLEFAENEHASHSQGTCLPVEFLKERGCDAVVCRKMADHAVKHFRLSGVECFCVDAMNLGEAIRKYQNRETSPFVSASPGALPASCQAQPAQPGEPGCACGVLPQDA
jgi:predicted Fe-Mo cluster-binding NifX family protein